MLIQTPRTRGSLLADLCIALTPALLWGIYLYGGRAAAVLLLCGLSGALFDRLPTVVWKGLCSHKKTRELAPVAALLAKQKQRSPVTYTHTRVETGFSFAAGLVCGFWFPPTVPLWLPLLAGAFVALCRRALCRNGRCFVSASAFPALLMTVIFPQYLLRFTKPFAYFPFFPITPDPTLVQAYRVSTPLDILQDGMLYEDGLLAQLYGFASGGIGAVAIAALLLGGVWLLIRRQLSVAASASYLLTLLVLAMALAPGEAEMFRYGLLYLLSGGIMLVAVFGLNDRSVLPRTEGGKWLFGLCAGVLTYVFREMVGGMGELYAMALLPLLTPLLERMIRPQDFYATGKKRKKVSA